MSDQEYVQAIINDIKGDIDNLVRVLMTMDHPAPPVARASNAKKLSKREVAKIRELSRLGAKNVDIAYGYDINPATVSRIVRRQYHK